MILSVSNAMVEHVDKRFTDKRKSDKEYKAKEKPISASDQPVLEIQMGVGDGVIPLTPPSEDMEQEKK